VNTPSIALNDGHSIPQLGLGTYDLRGEAGAEVVCAAIGLGYRHLDTARRYDNEEAVGEGIRRSGIERAELFVTTKLDGEFQGSDLAVAGLAGCLERLGLEYVDLLLIHWPLPARGEFISTWQTFERLRSEGLTRSIGVSNFKSAHLDALAEATGTVPAVNQIQVNPAIARVEERADHAARGIITESYSPFGGDGAPVLTSPVITRLASGLGKTPAQVVLRWHLHNGLVAIPKSATLARLEQNLDLDFELSAEDLAAIATLDVETGNDSDVEGH
jgi:2,5-diketo-D-gluconate reductase A